MRKETIEEVLYKLGEWGYTDLGYSGLEYEGKKTGTFKFHVPEEKDVKLIYDSQLKKFGLETRQPIFNFDQEYIYQLCREIKQISFEAKLLNLIIHNRETVL
ncbi:hypothetical protein [Bacillus atrophaeus]|uniref:hypothetical protein n=1 Tax=Bacillus atrophaeus TaxID=1452 RepID=UPI00227F41D5|nr:hypothetical protein [Bacillus atrophaeus]MCY8466464.1 hypothetical protein [Bacillus atrophaeus]MCY8478923.1 hypothetical protein [Bacillus atrophaeus]